MKEKMDRIKQGTMLCKEDEVWLCLACGKTSRTKYGFDTDGKNVCDHGWDVSCSMHSQLIKIEELKDYKKVRI
jgi:uncharacterized UBP type Zn finger protein